MVTRRTLGVIVAVAAILAWWLGSPLFLDRTVDEDFPHTATATIPDSTDQVTQRMPGSGAPEAILRGQFEDADRSHRGAGVATVYRLENGDHVLRFQGFRVTNGPDLRVLLSSHPKPTSRADLEAAGYVELGRLKGNVGDQDYPIPSEVELGDQRTVVIYCSPFHVVFSVARLEAVDE